MNSEFMFVSVSLPNAMTNQRYASCLMLTYYHIKDVNRESSVEADFGEQLTHNQQNDTSHIGATGNHSDDVGTDYVYFFFFFQAEDGIRDLTVTGVQTCALPI